MCKLISFAVPGGQDGPSGVIVCCENYLVYKNLGDQPDIKCPVPRRRVRLHRLFVPIIVYFFLK